MLKQHFQAHDWGKTPDGPLMAVLTPFSGPSPADMAVGVVPNARKGVAEGFFRPNNSTRTLVRPLLAGSGLIHIIFIYVLHNRDPQHRFLHAGGWKGSGAQLRVSLPQ